MATTHPNESKVSPAAIGSIWMLRALSISASGEWFRYFFGMGFLYARSYLVTVVFLRGVTAHAR